MMTNLELQLFKKTSDAGVIERYSLLVKGIYDRFGHDIQLPSGTLSGQFDSNSQKLVFVFDETFNLGAGEVAAHAVNSRTHIREISNWPWETAPSEIEVEVRFIGGGGITKSIAIADAEEEEARPITISTN